MVRGKSREKGFTIVELLTVMGVIAILIGLLVPALNKVTDYAKEIEQTAQFHSIDVAIELFKNEYGKYPESFDNGYVDTEHPDDNTPYGGSQKLAEALVGLDFLGFHPNSDFRADGMFWHDDGSGSGTLAEYEVYRADGPDEWFETAEQNVQARTGPFIDLENANAYRMMDVFEEYGNFNDDSLVLCDVFEKRREENKKTGMPILYFRARTQYTRQDYDASGGAFMNDIDDDIYYYPHNQEMLETCEVRDFDQNVDRLGDGTDDEFEFEQMILNDTVTEVSTIRRPYRADSYILISAGKDGYYGTPDDQFNFKKE